MTNEQIENELEHLADGLEHVATELEHLNPIPEVETVITR